MRELMQTKERVQVYSHIVSTKLLAERTAHLQVTETQYQDALVECAISGCLQWLRFQQRKGSSQRGNESLLGKEFCVGSTVLVTNLKPGRTIISSGALGLLLASDSSTVRTLDAGPSVTPGKDHKRMIPLDSGCLLTDARHPVSVLRPAGILLFPTLRSFAMSNGEKASHGVELTFALLILDWHVVDDPGDSGVAELKIFGVNCERLGVLLTYPIPRDLATKLPWLAANQVVEVDCALLEHIDAPKDILQMRRGERTVVSAVMSSRDNDSNTGRSSISASKYKPASGTVMSGMKRQAFAPPMVTPGSMNVKRSRLQYAPASVLKPVSVVPASNVACATPGPSSHTVAEAEGEFISFEKLPWLSEDERSRYAALRICGNTFSPSKHSLDDECCDREILPRATVKLDSSAAEGMSDAGAGVLVNAVVFDELSLSDREAVVDSELLAALRASCGFCGDRLLQVSELSVVLAQCHRRTEQHSGAVSENATGGTASWKIVWMMPAPKMCCDT